VATSQAHKHTAQAKAAYFLLGSGILAPWNALITAADYYETVYPVSGACRGPRRCGCAALTPGRPCDAAMGRHAAARVWCCC
jgi:hypothetical protein